MEHIAVTFIACVFLIVSGSPNLEETTKLLKEMNDILSEDDIKIATTGDLLDSLEKYVQKKKEYFEHAHSEKEKQKKEDAADVDNDLKEMEDFLLSQENEALEQEENNAVKREEKEKQNNAVLEALKEIEKVENDLPEDMRTVKNEEKCIDAAGLRYCYAKATKNACHDEPELMAKKCKRTCRLCCDDDRTFITTARCEKFATNQMCDRYDYQDRLRIFCPKTCAFCGKAYSEAYCVRTAYGCCWDGSVAKGHVGTAGDGCPKCKDRYGRQFCKNFQRDCQNKWSKAGQQIRLFCPATCQQCGPHKICEDDPSMADSCFQMKYEGNCINNLHAMRFSCAKTCGLCKHNTVACEHTKYGCCSDGKSIAKGWFKEGCKECTDILSNSYSCEFLKKHGACEKNEERMKVLCPATCGYCSQ